MPKTVVLDLGHTQYPILISDQIIADDIQPLIRHKRVMIVTNDVIAPLYLSHWQEKLLRAGLTCSTCILPDGERHKNSETLSKIYSQLLEESFSRNSTIIALGGGVIGDMSGFVAATYQRGIDLVQVPTSLLACVDSSVGGKTGINHPLGKNMIGAFYQPQAVLIEMKMLSTLPDNEYKAGLAEVIKYGCIIDRDFFCWLEANIEKLMQRDSDVLSYAIQRSCELKAQVVAEDEKETLGVRALLNLGHTFGHAIEAVQKYQGLKHGEAVAIGILIASDLSKALGMVSAEDVGRIKYLIEKVGLPMKIPKDVARAPFWQAMRRDKKNDQGQVKFILLKGLGNATLKTDVSVEDVETIVDIYFK